MLNYKTVNISPELHQALKMFCVKKGVSITEFLNTYLSEVLAETPLKKLNVPPVIEDTVGRPAGELNGEDYV